MMMMMMMMMMTNSHRLYYDDKEDWDDNDKCAKVPFAGHLLTLPSSTQSKYCGKN